MMCHTHSVLNVDGTDVEWFELNQHIQGTRGDFLGASERDLAGLRLELSVLWFYSLVRFIKISLHRDPTEAGAESLEWPIGSGM